MHSTLTASRGYLHTYCIWTSWITIRLGEYHPEDWALLYMSEEMTEPHSYRQTKDLVELSIIMQAPILCVLFLSMKILGLVLLVSLAQKYYVPIVASPHLGRLSFDVSAHAQRSFPSTFSCNSSSSYGATKA